MKNIILTFAAVLAISGPSLAEEVTSQSILPVQIASVEVLNQPAIPGGPSYQPATLITLRAYPSCHEELEISHSVSRQGRQLHVYASAFGFRKTNDTTACRRFTPPVYKEIQVIGIYLEDQVTLQAMLAPVNRKVIDNHFVGTRKINKGKVVSLQDICPGSAGGPVCLAYGTVVEVSVPVQSCVSELGVYAHKFSGSPLRIFPSGSTLYVSATELVSEMERRVRCANGPYYSKTFKVTVPALIHNLEDIKVVMLK